MLVGAMNHPQRDVVEEIEWMADMGLGFVDLTLEPPAGPWQVDPVRICRAIERNGLKVVGHTAYYLPIASPFEQVRMAAIVELKRCLEAFAEVGASWMNVHPDRYAPMHDRSFYIKRDIDSLRELIDYGRPLGVGVMIENIPGDFNTPEQLGELLNPLPELGLHLDIGHANLSVPYNMTESILSMHGTRLRHVHLHDNNGGAADLHLPLGAGSLDIRGSLRALKDCGYDGTITLEVFSPDKRLFAHSRDSLREIWDSLP